MDGTHQLHIPAGTQSGTQFRISRAGFPVLGHPTRHGDLFVTVQVVTPTRISKELRQVLETLAELEGDSVSEKKSVFQKVKDFFDS
jgi:molecular chaperone DnaJ